MHRKLVLLATATSLALGGALAVAGPAAAAPSNTSVHTFGCADSDHPGQHLGWNNQAQPNPGRNVGGTCLGPE
jgi:hypothetical protein